MEVHIKIIGALMVLLFLIHVIFPKYFDWKNDLKNLQLINRQMMWVHTFFVALIVFLMGILCLTSTHDLIHTPLGNNICLGIGFFWLLRLGVQFWGYSSVLWKGKKFETFIHILFSGTWTYFSLIFFNVFFSFI